MRRPFGSNFREPAEEITMERVSFADTAIVACGTLSLELNELRASGFLEGCPITYTTPGLHEDPAELEAQLVQRIQKALEKVDRVIVVYGGKFCYVNAEAPTRTMRQGWDKGLANENFPRHKGGAIVLDGIGYVERYMENHPEKFLEYSDWMGVPIQSYPVTLDRFKFLLAEQLRG
jgi:hypothetical protein